MYELVKYGSVIVCMIIIAAAVYQVATGKAKFQQKKK
ncbi:hypothetical protein CcarbDRAFT_0624 [Clostridium carboxidivorans P7]|uniref:Uncharacterized protein n=1 Tax=Clostridium carboxidivorans P7 TaxID=536227 RepID=C6PPA7_9CLOT|nr:hypothetical protein CcarbDRAFT_0624 [Clostridium carboxidivorans P7]